MPFGLRGSDRIRALSLAVLGTVIISGMALASAQETRPLTRDLSKDDHFKMGQVISSGMNSAPIGPLRVKTYQLERVSLTKPFETMDADGKKHSLDTAFRLKITLGVPPNGDYFIWIDDVPFQAYPSGYEKVTGENSVSLLLVTSRVPFENGSTLAISISSKKFELTKLPEKLKVPLDVRAEPLPHHARTHIKSIRSALIISGAERRPVVWITISTPIVLPVVNSAPTLHIWDKVFVGGTNGNEVAFMMGADEFAQLKDGAQVILDGSYGGVVERLNKSMLDR